MNQTKPIIPPGSVLEQKNQSQARFRLTVSCVFAAHFVFLGALLMQGCKREEATTPPVETALTPPPMETNVPLPELTAPPGMMPPAAMTATPSAPGVSTTPLPSPALAAGTEYTVVRGDSIYTIGKKFNVSMKAITEANPTIVDPNKLQPGQKLTIPAATAPAAAPGVSATNPGTGDTEYTVKSGDTLTSIAKAHNTTVNAIHTANNLTTDRIRVGQKLKIPAKTAVPPAAPVPSAMTPPPAPAAASVPSAPPVR